MSEIGRQAQERLGEVAGSAKTQAEDLAGEAQRQLTRISDVIRGQPVTSVLVALGIGYLLGRLLR